MPEKSKAIKGWTNNKFKKRIYKGSYQKLRKDRILVLSYQMPSKTSEFVFDSWQAAKAAGWVRL